jgi:hypothetical protein
MAEYLDEGLEGSRESRRDMRPRMPGCHPRTSWIEYRQPALNGQGPEWAASPR